MKPDEIKILKQNGLQTGSFFLFFKTKGAKLFRQILMNVFFENLSERSIDLNFRCGNMNEELHFVKKHC